MVSIVSNSPSSLFIARTPCSNEDMVYIMTVTTATIRCKSVSILMIKYCIADPTLPMRDKMLPKLLLNMFVIPPLRKSMSVTMSTADDMAPDMLLNIFENGLLMSDVVAKA